MTSLCQMGKQSGQGVIEYLLVLVVVTSIIIGLIYQFNTAFRDYAKNYFGDYLACLLETGELPTIGGGGGNGLCNESFKPFTWAGGRSPIDSSSSKTSYNPPERSSNSNSNSKKGSSGRGGGNAGRGSATEGGFSNGNRITASSSKNSKSSGEGDAKGSDDRFTGSTKAMPLAGYGSWKKSAGGYASRITINDRRFASNKNEKEKKKNVKAEGSKTQDSGDAQQKRVLISSKKREVASTSEDDSWSMGNLFKYLLMAAIIIAIVVFLGGQVTSVTKGWNKN